MGRSQALHLRQEVVEVHGHVNGGVGEEGEGKGGHAMIGPHVRHGDDEGMMEHMQEGGSVTLKEEQGGITELEELGVVIESGKPVETAPGVGIRSDAHKRVGRWVGEQLAECSGEKKEGSQAER